MFHQPLTSYQVSLISDEVDFWQTLKSHDSITRRKFKNPAWGILDFGLVSETVGIFLIGWKMADEIDFENRHFWNFKSHVTLTLTSDDLESDIVVNDLSTLTNTTIWFVAALSLIVDVRTYVRTTDGHSDGRTFLPGLLGHLWVRPVWSRTPLFYVTGTILATLCIKGLKLGGTR